MNRQLLAEATSIHEGSVPLYLLENIGNQTHASERDAEKIAHYLLGRLTKSNFNVKLKALEAIAYCMREGNQAFESVIANDLHDIRPYADWNGGSCGPSSEEKGRRMRAMANEILQCVRKYAPNTSPVSSRSSSPRSMSTPLYNEEVNGIAYEHPSMMASRANTTDNRSVGHNLEYNRWSHQNSLYSAPMEQHEQHPNQSNQYQYNNRNGSEQTQNHDKYGVLDPRDNKSYYSSSYNEPQYSGNAQYQSSNAPKNTQVSSVTSGVWSNQGFQRSNALSSSTRYNCSSSRDNRPMVLSGRNPVFAKPLDHIEMNNLGSSSSRNDSFIARNRYNYNGSCSNSKSNIPLYIHNTTRLMNSNSFSVNSTQASFDNSNKWNSNGYSGQSVPMTSHHINHVSFDDRKASKLSKTVEGLKKMSLEAKEKWECRNMDKSVGLSLADHDVLRFAPQPVDGDYQQPKPTSQANDFKEFGQYERSLIDNLCVSKGLARPPPAAELGRFINLAQTLQVDVVGDILLEKLQDSAWQARLKSLYVVLALIQDPGCTAYIEWFEENIDVFNDLCNERKPSIANKATQVLRLLGYSDAKAVTSKPRAEPANSNKSVNVVKEVDLLDLDVLEAEPPSSVASNQSSFHLDLVQSREQTLHTPSLLNGLDMTPMSAVI